MKSDLFAGRCLFHLHTNFTDGLPSVEDYFRFAAQHGRPRLIFLEHIRRQPSYDVRGFVDEVARCREAFALAAHVGFEVKILADGELDIRDEHLALADVIGVAEHSFPGDLACYQAAVAKALAACRPHLAEKTAVWVHPGLWLKKHERLDGERQWYVEMLQTAQASGLLVERNLRYDLLQAGSVPQMSPGGCVVGVDAHSLEDFKKLK